MRTTVAALFVIAALTTGCKTNKVPQDDFIASLADTVWAGEEREIVLTTATGAWYYADALGAPRRSVYGFYLLETKVFDIWELKTAAGESLCENAEYAVVHPEYCLRHYANDVEERIECIPGHDAMAISYTFKSSTPSFFRLYSSGNTIAETSDAKRIKAHSTVNKSVAFSENVLPSTGMFQSFVDHPRSALIGEEGATVLSTDREYTIPSVGKLTCLITASEETNNTNLMAANHLKNLPKFRKKRRQQSEAALSRFQFRCEDKSIERGYAWARLMLAGMYFERDGESRIFAGFPQSPYMDSFHSSLSGVGLILADASRSRSVRLFETILARQKESDDPEYPSRLPIEIHADSSIYRSGIAAGAMALSFDRVVSLSDSVPLGLPTHFLKALDKAVGAELNSSHHNLGLITGPGLFPNIGFPPRERHGALFETQALFAVARSYLAAHREGSSIDFEVPEPALLGTREWNYPYFPAIAVGLAEKQFRTPLSIESMTARFRNRSWLWFDRLLIPEVADESMITPQMIFNTPCDSTQSVVHILSIAWLEKNDKRIAERLIPAAEKNGLIGTKGFRSLSENEPEFQSSHVFVCDDQQVNAGLSGDVLVWTAGVLADLYTLTGRQEACSKLFSSLSETVLGEGVMGGLPESENGISNTSGDNSGRNPLFASSLAEFVRILYDDLLGVDTKRHAYPGIRLTVPAEWGKIEFSFEAVGAVITVKRLDAEMWSAEQNGSADQIPLEVELWPESDVRGYGSIKLNPNYMVKFKVIPTSVGRYTLAWDEYPREK